MSQPQYDNNFRYISITQMVQLLGCPFQWHIERQKKARGKQPFVFIFGNAIHETEDQFLKSRMAGVERDLMWLLDTFSGEWLRLVSEAEASPKYDGVNWIDLFGEENSPDYLEAVGKQMVAAFHKEINPHLRPVQAEKMHHIDVPGAPGWKLTIKTDMAGPHPETGVWTIYDHKTSLFPWKKGKTDNELQATGSLWANNHVETNPVSHDFIYNIVTKGAFGKPVKAYQESTKRTDLDLAYFEEQMRQCIRLIKGGGFVMQPFWEKHQYCPVKEFCPAGHMNLKAPVEPSLPVGDIEL